MVRFLLTTALLCVLGAFGLGIMSRAKFNQLSRDLAEARRSQERAGRASAEVQERLRNTQERQAGEVKQLSDEQGRLRAELEQTQARLAAATVRAEAAEGDKTALTRALTEAGRSLDAKAQAENERNALAGRLVRVENALNQYRLAGGTTGRGSKTKAQVPVEGTVLSVNPAAQALTVSLGTDAGIAVNAALAIVKNGTVQGKLRAVSVEKESCVAEFPSKAPDNFAKVAVGDPVTLSTR